MVRKRKIRLKLADRIMLRGEYHLAAVKALDNRDYSAAAAMCHRAHQQQKVIEALEALL